MQTGRNHSMVLHVRLKDTRIMALRMNRYIFSIASKAESRRSSPLSIPPPWRQFKALRAVPLVSGLKDLIFYLNHFNELRKKRTVAAWSGS